MRPAKPLSPSEWPKLRKRLLQGSPLSADTREDIYHTGYERAYAKAITLQDYRDWITPSVFGRTLVLTGSKNGFAVSHRLFTEHGIQP